VSTPFHSPMSLWTFSPNPLLILRPMIFLTLSRLSHRAKRDIGISRLSVENPERKTPTTRRMIMWWTRLFPFQTRKFVDRPEALVPQRAFHYHLFVVLSIGAHVQDPLVNSVLLLDRVNQTHCIFRSFSLEGRKAPQSGHCQLTPLHVNPTGSPPSALQIWKPQGQVQQKSCFSPQQLHR